ncbi:protoporphyrinogen oxidase [Microlunatus sp. Y2014]|uniref:protoporphyrinogen oxidase n=1 Tax=Microlunatus sp. Y2014 TaxID=3418488 RepID=UPI003DA7A324
MKVAVVGGGVAGLTAALELSDLGAEVIVLEAAPRLGGKVHGVDLAGFGLDVGAESVLATAPEGEASPTLELLDRLDRPAVPPEPVRAQLLVDGTVRPVPPSLVGVPFDADDLVDLLTPDGLARARREPEVDAPPLDHDVAIGDLVADRFGAEVVDRLLEPMLGGVYAGHARELSFAGVAPALWQRVRGGGSISAHARAARSPTTPGQPRRSPLVGTPGGIHGVVAALAETLRTAGVEVRTGATVRSLSRTGAGWQLVWGPTINERVLDVDAVVLATPAAPTARLLADVAPAAATELAQVSYASVAVVTVLATGLTIDGSGLLVPPGELPTIKAFTHSSRKWGWVRERLDRAHGAEHDVVRISIGRAGGEHQLHLDDDQLLARTLAETAQVPGWAEARVVAGHVQRWGGGLPQYAVGHPERMARATAAIAELPGLAACGAVWQGPGIAACLRTARAAARAVRDRSD